MKRVVCNIAISIWCVGALWIAASFCSAVLAGLYDGPFKDMWWIMPLVESFFSGHARVQDFLAVHGGAHRLLIPRLLYLMDYGVFAGNNRLLVALSLLTQWVAFVIWFLQIRTLPVLRPVKLFMWGLVLLVCFSGLQLENVLYTFDIQWFLANTFSLLALVYLVRILVQPERWQNGVAAVFFGVCASFCSFLGVCVLILIAVVGVVVHRRNYREWLRLLFITFFIAWYVSGFEHNTYAAFDVLPREASWGAAGIWILRLCQWTLIYLGSPLTRDYQLPGMLLAAAAIVYVSVHGMHLLRNPLTALTPPRLFFLFAAIFALGVAVATGLGRMYFINTADEDRYQTINMTFWLGTWLLLLSSVRDLQRWQQVFRAAVVVLWAGYTGICWHSRDVIARLREFEQVQASVVAQAVGVTDYAAIRDTLILGDKSRQINRGLMHADFLRSKAWGAYASDVARHYGLPVLPAGQGGRCRVSPLHIEALSAGHWKLLLQTDQPGADRIWLVDQDNLLRGAATAVRWQYANAIHVFALAPPVVEWLGYANLDTTAISSLKALVFRTGRLECEAVILLP